MMLTLLTARSLDITLVLIALYSFIKCDEGLSTKKRPPGEYIYLLEIILVYINLVHSKINHLLSAQGRDTNRRM